jgi:hypothetical protein
MTESKKKTPATFMGISYKRFPEGTKMMSKADKKKRQRAIIKKYDLPKDWFDK